MHVIMNTLTLGEYQCSPVQQFLAAHAKINKATIQIRNNDRLADLSLEADGAFEFEGMDIEVTHHLHTDRLVTTMTLTSTAHDLEWMLKFVQKCKDWERHVQRSSFKEPWQTLLWRWWSHGETWKIASRLCKRPLSKVHIESKEDIVADLTHFLTDESHTKYESLGIHHKRVYLLHGSHGTGKSALIHALAAEFDKSLAIIDCTNTSEATYLEASMRKLPRDTFLCIENMDLLFAKEVREESKASLSAMLGVLDGRAEISRLVIFVTACNIAKFDPAILHRVDYSLEMTFRAPQILAMLLDYRCELSEEDRKRYSKKIIDKRCCPATLQKYLLRYKRWDDGEFAQHCAMYAESKTTLYN